MPRNSRRSGPPEDHSHEGSNEASQVRSRSSTAGERLGIQSVEVGFPLVDALRQSPAPMTLANVARATGMTRTKAHRYLASFVRVGLVEQLSSGAYDLGPKALLLGLAAMQRVDVMRCADPIMIGLRDTVDETVLLAIWANQGPTIVRWIENRSRPVNVSARTGSVMPLLTSATGRTFLGWNHGPEMKSLIEMELAKGADSVNLPWRGLAEQSGILSMKDVTTLQESIRRRGVAVVDGTMFSGIAAISAPIFDHSKSLVASLAIVGPHGAIDVSEGSVLEQALSASARLLSSRMGAGALVEPDTSTASIKSK
jgi:DNA-binding IclR family transcriptional regulator